MASAQSEPQFAALVDAIAADPDRREQLTDLLREDHPLYDQRGAATVVRMRGWVLLAMARGGLSDAALIFVLEELDTGVDAYLVAAAARALRSYPRPTPALAPFVMRALTNIRYRDEPVSFETYGEYAVSTTDTTAVRELFAALAWLGPHARGLLPELESLRASSGFPRKLRIDVDRALQAIRSTDQADGAGAHACCAPPGGLTSALSRTSNSRPGCESIESMVFEDHQAELVTFKEFFQGQPSIVVFFYTRCDNPLKCSLTVTKLARIQKLLEAQGLADRIRTAAITYDPAFDHPARLRVYGQDRGVRMDQHHRMLRATDDNDALRGHFELGVNFVESLVNRHRIEVHILDAEGRTAAFFERIHWDERQVVARAVEVLKENEHHSHSSAAADADGPEQAHAARPPYGSSSVSQYK
jgi:protein SCO1/2